MSAQQTIQDPDPDAATIHIERYGPEHRGWLLHRYTAPPQFQWLIVRRRNGKLTACFPGYTAHSYDELVEQAHRIATTWYATFTPRRALLADLASPATDKAHDLREQIAADEHAERSAR